VATTPIDSGARMSAPRASWLVLAVAVATFAAAANAGPVLALVVVSAAVTAGSTVYATILIRLALAMHRGRRSFGPCRGAGFLGMGVLLAGTGVCATGVTEMVSGPARAALVAAGATVVAAPTFLLGLLLLPGAAPTLGARLRRLLDGLGIGISLLFTAWLLVLGSGHRAGAITFAITMTCCVALAVTVVTGLRAARHRAAALACSSGAGLSIAGIGIFAVSLNDAGMAGWLAIAGTALLAGPPLIVAGARRADDVPAPPDAADTGTFAAYPLLLLPTFAAAAAATYHFLTAHRFDAISIALAIGGVSAVAVREAMAARDVRQYARRLASQEAHFRTLVAGSSDVTIVLDDNLLVRWQSPAAARQFGLSDQDVMNKPFTALLHPDDNEPTHEALTAVLEGRQHGLIQARLRDGFGRWRDTESTISDQRGAPAVAGLVVHMRDVGDRAQLQRTLDTVTWTDDLTGLANRRKLLASIAEAQRLATPVGALLIVGLERFASVNDLHGPAVGDAVLVEMARRLRAGAGPSDVLARLSADSFAVLTPAPPVHAFSLATKLATMLAEPFQLPGHTVHLAAGVGIADLSGGEGAEQVLRHADVARRRARQLGRGRVESYDRSFETVLLRRTEIEQELPGVAGRGELDLVFQPVLDLAYRQPVGVEALLRWRHPRLGSIPPAEFVPIAEQLGLIDEIGVWSLHQACRQLSRWRRDGRDLWMSVNVSARQLAADAFLASVAEALDTHCVAAESVIVEVAEAALPDDAPAVERLAGLRALGVRTAIDHFGTGPTALAHLRRLPVDVLKIDRVLFSEPAGQRGPATPIVDVVVALAKRLGIDVVAAGLETESHVDVVRAAGCRYGQGYLLSPPDHAEHIEAFLELHRSPLF
jgi:diguanylate cyclase (GGDEF)-like protein/PAS domain S-box-containing protein